MLCPHCCFAATNKGVDMTHEVFIRALQAASKWDGIVTLGGGEPTCNKHFLVFLEKAIEFYDRGQLELPPLVITNGKLKTKAHKMLDWIDQERSFSVELSQDPWHDPIDHNVVRRFESYTKEVKEYWSDHRSTHNESSVGIRTARVLGPWGRAADPARGLPMNSKMGECVCDDMFFDPDGTIWSCGCKHTKIGNVFDTDLDLSWYNREFAHTGGRDPEQQEAA